MILQVRCRLIKLADIFYFLNYDMYSLIKKSPENKACKIKRARDGTRTRDPDLGKVVLHQLSHSRIYLQNCLPIPSYYKFFLSFG